MRRSRRPFLAAATAALGLTLAGGLAVAAPQPRSAPASHAARADAPLDAVVPEVLGPADPLEAVGVTLALRGRDPEGLARAVAALGGQTASGDAIITPAEFGDRFGLARADEDQLVATLVGEGLTVIQRVPQRTTLGVRGAAADVGRVFGVRLERLRDPRTGTVWVAAAGAPVVPPALAGSVTGIMGLERQLPLSAIAVEDAPAPPARGLTPIDLARAYEYEALWTAGFRGEGQNVAILQLGRDTDEDLAVFDDAFGIQGPAPLRIAVGDGLVDAPMSFGTEAALDTQVIRAVAPKAQIIVYGFPTTTTFPGAVDTIVGDGKAKIISLSYGQCDLKVQATILPELAKPSFAAAALAGVTMYTASGDWGAFTCHVFDPTEHRESTFWPTCSDNLISVGGTFLETREDGSYLRETGWEAFLTTAGAGGGISLSDPMPAWQAGPGVQNDASNGNRQCPDVGAVADEDSGYLIFATDEATGRAGWLQMGGTSAAAPLWAGMTALMQQKANAAGLGEFGFMGPRLYRVWANEPEVYHDVQRGGNLVHDAGPGWDYSTGIGTPDVSLLSEALIRDLQANP